MLIGIRLLVLKGDQRFHGLSVRGVFSQQNREQPLVGHSPLSVRDCAAFVFSFFVGNIVSALPWVYDFGDFSRYEGVGISMCVSAIAS